MAMPGYFIEVTFTDGSVVTTYATVVGDWYYFYSDKRYRFTRGVGTNVILQQYQPIGTNMAWYDINIIQSVDVQQFDPSTSGGAAPDDVYTKEETDKLIQDAVNQIMANLDEIVAQKVDEAIAAGLGENYYTKQEVNDKFVKKSGDTMTGALYIRNGDNYFYCNGNEATLFGSDYNVFMNPSTGMGMTTKAGKYVARISNTGFTAYNNGTTVARMYNNNSKGAIAVYEPETGNNNWVEPTQVSCWVNNGTVQRTIVFENEAVSFNTTIQVPSNASFLVSGECRYSGANINRYGDYLDVLFNDYSYYALSAYQLNINTVSFALNFPSSGNKIYFNDGSVGINYGARQLLLSAASSSISMSNSNLTVHGTNGTAIGQGSSGVYLHNNTYNVELTNLINFGTTDQYYTINMMLAINTVINQIQDTIGTNYSSVIEPHSFSGTGGGTTRGGGCGRRY